MPHLHYIIAADACAHAGTETYSVRPVCLSGKMSKAYHGASTVQRSPPRLHVDFENALDATRFTEKPLP